MTNNNYMDVEDLDVYAPAQLAEKNDDRLTAKDKKRIARDIASTDPECTWTETATA